MKKLSERTSPASPQKLLHSLEHQAARCRMEGRYRNAEALYRRALLLSTQAFGPCSVIMSFVTETS